MEDEGVHLSCIVSSMAIYDSGDAGIHGNNIIGVHKFSIIYQFQHQKDQNKQLTSNHKQLGLLHYEIISLHGPRYLELTCCPDRDVDGNRANIYITCRLSPQVSVWCEYH